MTIPGGIRVKLSLALLVIVGSALLAAYAIIVPSLERRLVEAKLDQQQSDAQILSIDFATRVAQNNLSLGDFVDTADFVANSRVVVFGVGGTPGKRTLLSLADSVDGRRLRDGVGPDGAPAASERQHRPRPRQARRARVRGGRRAAAHRRRRDAALTSSLSDQLATVALVKRRLLFATVAALLISVVLGFAVAEVHARRLSRLQRAADRIAEGAFDEPVDRQRPRRGRAAGRVVRQDAPAAGPARPRTEGVRRERVARAAHAAVLDRRLPRAPRRRGSRREHADGVPRDDAAARSTASQTSPPTCSICRGWTPGGSGSRTRRSGCAEIARQVAEDFFAIADASGHTLLLDVDEDVWAHADEERIQQIARA